VRHQLNHVQAEFGDYGVRGGLQFSGLITATPGVLPLAWNQYAAFLLGPSSYFSKDVQTEEMIGRENQFGFYVRDRWEVARNLTLNLGLRAEMYPLMNRDTRGLERLEYDTYTVLIGGFGGVPRDVGIDVQKFYLAPRVGAAWRLSEESVARAGYGRTYNALPWSRPLRGSFPQDINFNRSPSSTPGRPRWPRASRRCRCRTSRPAGSAAARRVHAVAEPDPGRSQRHRPVQRRLRAAAPGPYLGGSRLRPHADRWRLCRPQPELR
jgi:outer membrane receptor protein involved in Fe transport